MRRTITITCSVILGDEWNLSLTRKRAKQTSKSMVLTSFRLNGCGADVDRLEIPARTEDEARFLVIGKIGEKCWSAVITYRGEIVRIISVRRSRILEVRLYESGSI